MSTSSDENFLARWSRLKRQPSESGDDQAAHQNAPMDAAHAPVSGDSETAAGALSRSDAGVEGSGEKSATAEAATPRDYSDFDFQSLNFQSDYAEFMRADIPRDVRNKALRQLWNSDPIFSTSDGLTDYCEDYTDAAVVPAGAIRTAYRIGRGFLNDAEVAEWDALGRPADPTVADAADDTGAGTAAMPSDLQGEPHHAVEGETMAAALGDASVVASEDNACPGAACAAAVKQEERQALEAFDAEMAGSAASSSKGSAQT